MEAPERRKSEGDRGGGGILAAWSNVDYCEQGWCSEKWGAGEIGVTQERGLGPGCSPQHGRETERGDTLGLTSRHRTASSSCMGRSRQSPYSGTPSCDETAQPLPRSAAPACSNTSLSWASTQRPLPATMPPQAPMVGTLTFHPKFTMQVTDGTPRGCSPPRRSPSLPPARPPAPLTCLLRLASWSWVLPAQEAFSSSSSSLFPRRCWGTSA